MKSLLTSILVCLATLMVGTRAVAVDSVDWQRILFPIYQTEGMDAVYFKLVIEDDVLYLGAFTDLDAPGDALYMTTDGRVWASATNKKLMLKTGTVEAIEGELPTWVEFEQMIPSRMYDEIIQLLLLNEYGYDYNFDLLISDLTKYKGAYFLPSIDTSAFLNSTYAYLFGEPIVYYYEETKKITNISDFTFTESAESEMTLELNWNSTDKSLRCLLAVFDGYGMANPELISIEAGVETYILNLISGDEILGMATEYADGSLGSWVWASGNLNHVKWQYQFSGQLHNIVMSNDTPKCYTSVPFGLPVASCTTEWPEYFGRTNTDRVSSWGSHNHLGMYVSIYFYPWVYSLLYGYVWFPDKPDGENRFVFSISYGWLYMEAGFVYQFDSGLWFWDYIYTRREFLFTYRRTDHYGSFRTQLLYRQTADRDGWELIKQYDEE